MINWCKQKTLFLIVCCSFWGYVPSTVVASEIDSILQQNLRDTVEQKLKLNSGIARITVACEAINPAYQEVYSFETENYHINICQLGGSFYYHRQSKLNQDNIILIPAQAILSGNVFQASDGRTTYFVGKDGDRYYSSVVQNNDEIVFEPELQLSPTNLSQGLAEANSSLPTDVRRNQANNASLELDNPVDNSESLLICTKEKSAFNPRLDQWQKLIGKSTEIANNYAVSNGHDFIYSEQTPNLASIITEDGAIIKLTIATPSETIERVCIQSAGDKWLHLKKRKIVK